MDANVFDALSRLFGSTGTRRAAVAAVAGGSLGLLALAEAEGRKKGRKRRKKGKKGKKGKIECQERQEECEFDRDCCAPLFCNNNISSKNCPGPLRFCCGLPNTGAACDDPCDCCGEVQCFDGFCGGPNVPG